MITKLVTTETDQDFHSVIKFKIKESILSGGYKIKETSFAVREDFCPPVRNARSRLIQYVKENGSAFKLCFDKLPSGGNIYSYNSTSDSEQQIRTIAR